MIMDYFNIQLLIQMKEADPYIWPVPSALYLQVQRVDLSRLYTAHQFLSLSEQLRLLNKTLPSGDYLHS